jgi:hypothetical protein
MMRCRFRVTGWPCILILAGRSWKPATGVQQKAALRGVTRKNQGFGNKQKSQKFQNWLKFCQKYDQGRIISAEGPKTFVLRRCHGGPSVIRWLARWAP